MAAKCIVFLALLAAVRAKYLAAFRVKPFLQFADFLKLLVNELELNLQHRRIFFLSEMLAVHHFANFFV